MLKFAGVNVQTGRPVLGIGLTRENCNQMLAGRSIRFDTSSLQGLPDIHVFILAGDSDEAMAFDMMKAADFPGEIGGDPTEGPVS